MMSQKFIYYLATTFLIRLQEKRYLEFLYFEKIFLLYCLWFWVCLFFIAEESDWRHKIQKTSNKTI